MKDWRKNWKIDDKSKERKGGQGTVQRVITHQNDQVGALKIMHSDIQHINERRFRMQQEVNVMKALSNGVPYVLDSNIDAWEDKNVPLFVIMEWIEGPTLSDRINKDPFSIDQALNFSFRILDIIDDLHNLGIIHRDLKPDNVILQSGNVDQPIIVDFGLAWRKIDSEIHDFKTPIGQELGNRFLRLPEHAPGRISRDHRSDLTVIVGLILYSISGKVLRVLRNESNKPPHDFLADDIPDHITDDPRWPRLRRVFNRAFQLDLELRFQTSDELRNALKNLQPKEDQINPVDIALEKLKDVLEDDKLREFEETQNNVQNECRKFAQQCSQIGNQADFSMPGSHGFREDGRKYKISFGLQRKGMSGGTVVRYYHEVHISDRELAAQYKISNKGNWKEYYRGSITDIESLAEAMETRAPILMADLITIYTNRISENS